jgi:VIT1/CCC1 family predicted Fe2+/Mn2+ transporter
MSPRRGEVQVRRFRELLASELRSAAQHNHLAEATSGEQRKVLVELAVTSRKDRDAALDTMAREEFGLDPDELGSPWSAAVSSLLSFALGAVVVVLPFVFGSGLAVPVAIASAGMALFMVGATLNWPKRHALWSAAAIGGPLWCLARLSNCGYLQCTVASRAVRLDS